MRWRAVLLLIVAWVDCPGRAADSDDAGRTADEQTLRAKGFKTDSLSLLRFFHARTLTPEKEEVYFAKVKQLGDTSYRVRNQATADLVKAGEQVRPVLQEVLKEGKYSLEILRRVELCLRQVSETDEEDVALAAARLIARSKPAGAAQVLLDYLPNASDERVVEEVRKALAAVAVRGGRAEETVLQALTDKRPIRRAAAGEALVRAGDKGQRQAARPLLEDPAPQVRLQVAHALAEAKEKSAVPVLIRLLAELPAEQVWEVEELLIRLAGEKSPNVFVDRDTATAKVRDAWLAWWNANQATVDLARLTENPGLLGYTLITQMDKGTTGRVLELKPNNEVH
jgi:HEAT repeat protein